MFNGKTGNNFCKIITSAIQYIQLCIHIYVCVCICLCISEMNENCD